MKGTETIFVTELERFGYTLRAAGRTKKEAEDAVLAEYYNAYMDYNNGAKPDEEILDEGNNTYYNLAKTELYTEELPFGKVWWS